MIDPFVDERAKERHERLHRPVGYPYVFKGREELSLFTKQPLCEVCGQLRGTLMPKDEPRVVIGERVEVEYDD